MTSKSRSWLKLKLGTNKEKRDREMQIIEFASKYINVSVSDFIWLSATRTAVEMIKRIKKEGNSGEEKIKESEISPSGETTGV